MKEFMFLIRNVGDGKAKLSSDEHLAFVKQCEVYIGKLKQDGKLIAAQPLIREGSVISKNGNEWSEKKVSVEGEISMNTTTVFDNKKSKASKKFLVTVLAASPIIFWIFLVFG